MAVTRRNWTTAAPFSNVLTFNGETLCIAEWVRRTGIKRNTILARLKKGMSVEKALTMPLHADYARLVAACEQCNKQFTYSRLEERQRFCSKACRNLSENRNPIRIDGDVAYLTLASGDEVLIDVADIPLVKIEVWKLFTGRNGKKYARGCGKQYGYKGYILLHRLLMGVVDSGRTVEVDHKNGSGLDCRRDNMRLCNHQQNMWNRSQPRYKSPYRGVSWNKRRRQWRASIRISGRSITIGSFNDPADAARAYDAKARQLCGEFAVTNFV